MADLNDVDNTEPWNRVPQNPLSNDPIPPQNPPPNDPLPPQNPSQIEDLIQEDLTELRGFSSHI